MAGTGIAGINEKLKSRRVLNGSNEVILANDGDAIVGVVASSGHDDDGLVATFYRHTYKGDDGNWKFVLCHKRTFGDTCKLCSTGEGGPPRHRFAFWMWVNSMFKTTAPTDEGWTAVTAERGTTLFERDIKDFRIVQLPIGRSEMYWEMFVDMYEVFGALDEKFMKVARKGKDLNTVWDIVETPRMNPRECDWTELDADKKRFNLMPILDYYKELDKSRSGDSDDDETTSLDNAVPEGDTLIDELF